MTDKTIIGQRIAELRKSIGLTQAELADKLGVSHQAVSQWERSETLPDILTLPKIAEVFGESISYLLGITETSQANKKDDETADKTDANPLVNENGAIVYDKDGVRVEISNIDVEIPNIVIAAADDDVEEKTLEMVDNTVEIPIDGGDYSIVLEKNGERVKIPWDLQERVAVILKGNCEDISCGFSLNVVGDVNGDVNVRGSISIEGDLNGDADVGGSITVCCDLNGDVSAGGNITVHGDIN